MYPKLALFVYPKSLTFFCKAVYFIQYLQRFVLCANIVVRCSMKTTKLVLIVIRVWFFLTSHGYLPFRRLHFPLAIDTNLWGKSHTILLVIYLSFVYWDTPHIYTFHCWWNFSGHSTFYFFTESGLNSGNFPLAEMKSPKQIIQRPCAKNNNGTQLICISKCSICPPWSSIRK